MGKIKIEKYDQYLLLPVLVIALLILFAKFEMTYWIFAGFILGILGLALFNKGRKRTVNLATDITYIALAFVLFIVAMYYLFAIQFDVYVLVIAILLLMVIGLLYR